MVLVDSSVWVELFRKTDSVHGRALRRHLDADEVATTDMIISELLAGTTDDKRLAATRRALDACTYLGQQPYVDAIAAADLYRACRRAGESPRQVSDCLVAAVAIRNDVPVLQRDRDYEVLGRHTALKVLAP
jgi:predicted nucleic acid-binding protein